MSGHHFNPCPLELDSRSSHTVRIVAPMIIITPPIGVQIPISSSPKTTYPMAVLRMGSNKRPTETTIGGIHFREAFNPV